MKKWAYLSVAAALAAIIGCGGGGGGHHTSGSTATDGGTEIGTQARVNIGNTNSAGVAYGRAEFDFLTGQGVSSRDPGDLSAVVRQLTLEDQYGLVKTTSPTESAMPLRTFTSQIVALDVPFTFQNSRLFESFDLTFLKFLEENGDGSTSELNPPNTETFPARIRVLPGRNTTVPILINDAMFTSNGTGVDFNVEEFRFRNLGEGGYLHSFLSDYVSFDISSMPSADRPLLSTGEAATRVFMSGDDIALSVGTETGPFEVLTTDPEQPIVGQFRRPNNIPATPGTYNLTQIDPTDLENRARITSLHGIWRELDSVINNVGNFEMILFPSAEDMSQQDLMIVVRNGGVITNLYFGQVDYDLHKFHAYPIKDVVNASVEGELTGTIDHYMTSNGTVTTSPDDTRFGHFAFDAGQNLPTGFANTGTFVVFRK